MDLENITPLIIQNPHDSQATLRPAGGVHGNPHIRGGCLLKGPSTGPSLIGTQLSPAAVVVDLLLLHTLKHPEIQGNGVELLIQDRREAPANDSGTFSPGLDFVPSRHG